MSRECTKLVFMFALWSSSLVSSEECERREFTAKFTVTCTSPPFSRELDYCIPGQKVNEPCSSDNVCGYCPDDQYQDVYTNCKTCIPCTTLESCSNGQVLIRDCESSSNAVCGCPPCPEVRCPTQPPVTCPAVPNTTCAPCLPCPTEPDITTTLERTCPPCPAAEEKNPTSPSDDKPFTCPPVEPCPTPEFDPLVSSLEDKLMLWKIWGIIAAVIILGFLFAYILLYCFEADCLKKLCPPAHGGPENENHNLQNLPFNPPHWDNNPTQPQDVNGSNPGKGNKSQSPTVVKPPVGATNGGDDLDSDENQKLIVEMTACGNTKGRDDPDNGQLTQKGSNVYISMPQGGADATEPLIPENASQDGAKGSTQHSATEPLMAENASEDGAKGSTQHSATEPLIPENASQDGAKGSTQHSGKTLDFARPELGEEMMQDFELDAIADRVYDIHWGRSVKSLESFFTKLRLDSKDYGKYLMDAKDDSSSNKIFHVLRRCQQEKPRSRNHYRKYLKKIDEDLSDYLVKKVNEEYASEDTDSKLDLFHQTGGNGQTSQSEDLGIVIHS